MVACGARLPTSTSAFVLQLAQRHERKTSGETREGARAAGTGRGTSAVRVGTERGVWKRMMVVGRSFYVGQVWTEDGWCASGDSGERSWSSWFRQMDNARAGTVSRTAAGNADLRGADPSRVRA